MDYARLRLASKGDPAELNRILQMELRHKHGSKFHSTLLNPAFEFPDALAAEQATSDDLAILHATLIDEGERVLDMTCGLGIDAFHLARRAVAVTAFELKPHVAEATARNAAVLGLTNVDVRQGDSVVWLAGTDERFDTIFIDPARRAAGGGRLYALSDCQPDVVALLPLLRSRCQRLVVKASPMLDVSRTVADLGGDADILLLGTTSECKELVAVVPGNGMIRALTVDHGEMAFTRADEAAAIANFGDAEAGEWLHEPFPPVMKSGALKLLSARFGLKKLAADTHLYVGDETPDFPGKKYRIRAVEPFDKRGIKAMRQLAAQGAEVAVRNFGQTADELRRRLGVSDSSSARIYGVRDSAGRRVLILADK